jgi:hypothetical protein
LPGVVRMQMGGRGRRGRMGVRCLFLREMRGRLLGSWIIAVLYDIHAFLCYACHAPVAGKEP